MLTVTFLLSPISAAVEVLVNESVNVKSLTTSQLRSIFSMRTTQWKNTDDKIVVFVLASDSKTHLQFCQTKLKIFPYVLKRIWDKLTFSGLGARPIEVSTPEEMLYRVQTTPGAIGYLDDMESKGGVNVITISR